MLLRTTTCSASRRPSTMKDSFLVLYLLFLHVVVSATDISESKILLRLKNSFNNAAALADWDLSRPICGNPAWSGVICINGSVWGLQLENLGLEGAIDVQNLAGLPNLRSVSFMYNNLSGNIPNFSKVSWLKAVYLSGNRFSGEIGEQTFTGMDSLKKLHLADDQLTGKIPATLAALPRLIELVLDRNELEGGLPNFPPNQLQVFNVSHNKLSGEIPASLAGFNVSLFSDNGELCGEPLDPCSAPIQIPSQSQTSKLYNGTLIITIVAALLALVAVILSVVVIIFLLRRPNQDASTAQKNVNADLEQGQASLGTLGTSPDTAGKQNLTLTFIREDNAGKFDLSDLLKASAELLGKGVLGIAYKAALDDEAIVVVKRFKRMRNASREEFHEHMRRLGRLNHENVLPIVAFYYKKDEKLLVTDYAANSSVAALIHGGGPRARRLDWPTRLGIVKGVALGLQHLDAELPSLTTPHGHLKSSNVLLGRRFKPLLTDYGLIPIVSHDFAQKHMVAYKSPEYNQCQKLSKKTDVWSFGILILEILTGKPPGEGCGVDNLDLAKWIELIVRDIETYGGPPFVFERNMAGANQSHGEMAKLLKIGLECSREEPKDRPDIGQVVGMLEEIKEKDVDDDFYSTYSTEADLRSSTSRRSDDLKTIN